MEPLPPPADTPRTVQVLIRAMLCVVDRDTYSDREKPNTLSSFPRTPPISSSRAACRPMPLPKLWICNVPMRGLEGRTARANKIHLTEGQGVRVEGSFYV
jgi:hypothetical protein